MGDRRTAFVARREAMGYTQETFAAELKVEFSTVGRWERGEATPQPFRRPRIAKALGVTLQELGTLLGQAPAPARCPATVAVVPPDLAEADDMNRRDLLRLFSATGALLALPPATGDVARAAAAGAEEFAVFASHLWRVYGLASNKSQVLPLVRTQLDVLTDALRQSQTPATRQRLCRLTADLFQLAGEIYFDGDRYTNAAHCYALAADASKEAGAPDLWACALTRHAFIAVYERHFIDARPLLDLAANLASRGDTGLSTRHWVAAVQAETFAGLGDLDACQHALDTAAEVQHLTGRVHNGGWLRFDGSRLAEERGTCYVTLGRLELAEAALADALNGALTARRKAGVLTDLAMIGVHRADPDQVITYADAVLATARQTGSGVVARKLRGLQPYLAPLLADQNIQRLDAEIAGLVSGHAA
ncbi:helix-turn-helix domain-containing protein [Amycolatopsis sp. cmx-11-32]|uniref:helix-turn-helix domain-containing protein n=1 Tax=Amycolatopsis sp. cmx-11-32 TaxID=2785796 RepID=UPI0039E57BF6